MTQRADAIAVQESRLDAKGQIAATKLATRAGYKIDFGCPLTTKRWKNSLKAKPTTGYRDKCDTVRQGGVAVLVRDTVIRCGKRDSIRRNLYDTTRWIRTAVPISRNGCVRPKPGNV